MFGEGWDDIFDDYLQVMEGEQGALEYAIHKDIEAGMSRAEIENKYQRRPHFNKHLINVCDWNNTLRSREK